MFYDPKMLCRTYYNTHCQFLPAVDHHVARLVQSYRGKTTRVWAIVETGYSLKERRAIFCVKTHEVEHAWQSQPLALFLETDVNKLLFISFFSFLSSIILSGTIHVLLNISSFVEFGYITYNI